MIKTHATGKTRYGASGSGMESKTGADLSMSPGIYRAPSAI